MKRNCLLSLLGCIVLWGSAGFAWSIPTEIGVSGRLLDSNGNPIHYTIHDPMAGTVEQHVTLPSRIDFWDSTTAATPFASLLTVTSAFNGYFNMGFVPPISVITKDVIWYSVAIDVDRNGLTSSDNFPERIQITSMPYALSAKPQNAFVTFQGIANYQYAGFQDPKFLHVTPFETPPGGVEFNQMNIFPHPKQGKQPLFHLEFTMKKGENYRPIRPHSLLGVG